MKEALKLFWHVLTEPLRIIWDFYDNDAGKIVSSRGWEVLEEMEIESMCAEIRAKTGHALMDCKKALIYCDYNKKRAITYLGSEEWRGNKLINLKK